MDWEEDMQQPNEARPAKRARLEASLDITEDLQEELVDDDADWDDIYGNGDEDAGGVQVNGDQNGAGSESVVLPALPLPAQREEQDDEPHQNGEKVDGAPQDGQRGKVDDVLAEGLVDSGDELVAEKQQHVGTDEPASRMIEETSQIDAPHGAQPVDLGVSDGLALSSEQQLHEDSPDGANGDNVNVNAASVAEASVNGDTDNEETVSAEQTQSNPKPADDPEFLEAAAAQKDNEEAEWQFDSSDAESSSSDSSSDDSDDESESSSEGGYEMLDPATAAKILMSGDGDGDDGDKASKGGNHQPRTMNEVTEEVVLKPDVTVTEDMKITYLGSIERSVDNMILIKAATPGEFQVLEGGSVLCKENREVIGAVGETLGRVQEPIYSVSFTNAKEIVDAELEVGTKLFYVDSHSTFVFTQPLRNLKGTDASNIHDEEVGEDELEFSDDEKEAEYKRAKKQAKRGGRAGPTRSEFTAQNDSGARSFGAPGHDSGQTYVNGSYDAPQHSYGGGGLSYDDGDTDVQDDFYVPLKRPDNLSQLMAGPPPRGHFDRGRGRGGRGDRGRGRDDRGRGRGGFDRNQRGGRGGQNQDGGGGRGGQNQQNGHRGNAHSFPDRHNDRGRGQRQHSSPSRQHKKHHSPPPPPSQQQYHPYQQPAPSPQNYQFNGYTFQYGTAPLGQPQQQNYQYPQQQQQQQPPAAQSPTGIPAGAYVNPAFFQNQQAPAQWQQPGQQAPQGYGAWPAQQYPQQAATSGGYAAPQQVAQQPSNDLANILRQLAGPQQQQQQQQQQQYQYR